MTLSESDAPWIEFDDVVVYRGSPRRDGHGYEHGGKAILFVPDSATVVVQRGHAFRERNPGIPVFLERGRLALVNVDPLSIDAIPTSSGYAVIDPGDLPNLSGATDVLEGIGFATVGDVEEGVAAIKSADLERLVRALSAFETRHWQSPHYDRSANLARDWFKSFGYETLKQPVFTDELPHTYNVIARRSGRPEGADRIVVCAHLDSVSRDSKKDLTAAAPGAADNASGCASLIAIAHAVRKFALFEPSIDVEFVLFGAEEAGLGGSESYVKGTPEEPFVPPLAVLNLDMPAVKKGVLSPRVLLDPHRKDKAAELVQQLANCAATYVPELEVHRLLFANIGSDHLTFGDLGVPSTLVIEDYAQDNTTMHTDADIADQLDFAFHEKVTRMCCAWAMHMLKGGFTTS